MAATVHAAVDVSRLIDERTMSGLQWLVAIACALSMFIDGYDLQVMALTVGRDNVLIAPQAAQDTVREQSQMSVGRDLAWPGCLRKLDRESPGYDA